MKQAAKAILGAGAHRTGFLRLAGRASPPRVSILMYHRVHDEEDPLGLAVTPDHFDRQMRMLKDGYRVVSLGQAVREMTDGELSGHLVVVTFDDGYRDNYTLAYPVLVRHGIPAAIFIVPEAITSGHFGWSRFDEILLRTPAGELDLSEYGLGIVPLGPPGARAPVIRHLHAELKKMADGTKRALMAKTEEILGVAVGGGERVMLSWGEVREMASGGLVTIGSHTLTHPILTRIPPEQARAEIENSKLAIEARLGIPADHFAYPNGGPSDFDDGVIRDTRECGYLSACTTISGVNGRDADPFTLRRIAVTRGIYAGLRGGFSEGLFASRLSSVLDGVLFRS